MSLPSQGTHSTLAPEGVQTINATADNQTVSVMINVQAKADLQGLNHLFTFFAFPGPVTCFQGVQMLPAGHFLRIQRGGEREGARLSEHK